MPKIAIDYSKTIIYKLCCNDINITDIYIGHTTDFKSRKNQHKQCCNNEKNKKHNINVYQFIRDNGGWDNWYMVMVEEYSCNSLLEATKRERYYIEELKATLNSNIPSRTKKEYRIDNLELHKKWDKERRLNNIEIFKEKDKLYYENNKDKIKERVNKKINCDCSGCYTINNKSKHIKTKLHQEYLTSLV